MLFFLSSYCLKLSIVFCISRYLAAYYSICFILVYEFYGGLGGRPFFESVSTRGISLSEFLILCIINFGGLLGMTELLEPEWFRLL